MMKVENLKKIALERRNARMFNKTLNLYYIPKTIIINYDEVEDEVLSGNDVYLTTKLKFSLSCTFYIYTSKEGISNSHPVNTHKLTLDNLDDIKISEIFEISVGKLSENFEDSKIINF